MGTLQGDILTRIAAAHRRAVDAEAAYQEAKGAVEGTEEWRDLENARAEQKEAKRQMERALEETEQLPLPGPSGEAIWDEVACQVNAGAIGSDVTAKAQHAARVVAA